MPDSDRVAELKRKMQEKAAAAKAEAAAKEGAPAGEGAASAGAPVATPKPTETAVTPANAAQAAASVPPLAAPVAVAPAVAAAAGIGSDPEAPAGVVGQGAAVPVAPAASAAANGAAAAATNGAARVRQPAGTDPYVEETLTPEQAARREMNRREFLTYAFGGALALVGLGTGVGVFQFMYPRFRAGEFGGKFFLGAPDSMPATDAPPIAEPTGKFWLVNTEDEGVKAIYMVCTHLGCLYKWEPSTVRFECPCHGSKFTREGFYIEGPAPRSLDRFEVTEEEGQVVVNTGRRITGDPASESPARAAA